MAGENWTFWLMFMNYALGVITLAALLLVGGAVSWEILAKKVQSRRALAGIAAEVQLMFTEPHGLSVPELGLTMADGGEKITPPESEASDTKAQRK